MGTITVFLLRLLARAADVTFVDDGCFGVTEMMAAQDLCAAADLLDSEG